MHSDIGSGLELAQRYQRGLNPVLPNQPAVVLENHVHSRRFKVGFIRMVALCCENTRGQIPAVQFAGEVGQKKGRAARVQDFADKGNPVGFVHGHFGFTWTAHVVWRTA